ncbi:hypothetical protein, partial [Shigella sonnei]
GEYLPGSLQGKISSDGCLKKEQMVVSAIASTPHSSGDEAKVIPFNAVEADDQEDYSLPTYVPELFQDPPEKDES